MSTATTWPILLRRYFALRREDDFGAALSVAPDHVKAVLRAAHDQDYVSLDKLSRALAPTLDPASDETGTLRLAYDDAYVAFIETHERLPIGERSQAFEAGLQRCHDAIDVSEKLGDLPCVAFFTAELAIAHYHRNAPIQAEEACRRSLALWRRLAVVEPGLYGPMVERTDSLLAYMLKQGADASAVTQEIDDERAIQMLERELDAAAAAGGRNPNEYGEDVAKAHARLAEALDDVRRLEMALKHRMECLAIARRLGEQDGERYRALEGRAEIGISATLRQMQHATASRPHMERGLEIFRELEAKRPGAHRRELAIALNNLGDLHQDLNEFARARELLEESLSHLTVLSQAEPDEWESALARAQDNLAKTLTRLHEPRAALALAQQACAACERLIVDAPRRYEPRLGRALTTLGTAHRLLGQFDDAYAILRRAHDIFQDLATAHPQAHRVDLADALTNLGIAHVDRRDTVSAQRAFGAALVIYDELCAQEPDKYRANRATLLRYLGSTSTYAAHARDFFRKSLEQQLQSQHWLDAADSCADLADVEQQFRNTSRAVELFERSSELLNRAIRDLPAVEHQHRDLFKRRLESAYIRLISHYSGQHSPEAHRRLPRLFETLRRVERLDDADDLVIRGLQAAAADEPEATWKPTADRLREHGAAFLWIQSTTTAVVFGVVRPDRPFEPVVGDRAAVEALAAMTTQLRQLFGTNDRRSAAMDDLARRGYAASNIGRELDRLGRVAFGLLPSAIRDLLHGRERATTVFISPCQTTIDFPFELLIPEGSGRCLGLDVLFVRVHGIAELAETLQRFPVGRRASLVGSPIHAGYLPLPAGRREVEEIERRLSNCGWNVSATYGLAATGNRIIEQLHQGDLTLFMFAGHGDVSRLALAGNDEVTLTDFSRVCFSAHAFVHLDCCYAGVTRGMGGGRFEGMPTAALQAGASAVVASFHPLRDDAAAEFSVELYDRLLSGRMALGHAILAVRQHMHRKHNGDVLVWAFALVWGNPAITMD